MANCYHAGEPRASAAAPHGSPVAGAIRAMRCCPAASFDPSESKRFNALRRLSASNQRAERQSSFLICLAARSAISIFQANIIVQLVEREGTATGLAVLVGGCLDGIQVVEVLKIQARPSSLAMQILSTETSGPSSRSCLMSSIPLAMGFSIGTIRAAGMPSRARIISSPCSAREIRCDNRILASSMLTVSGNAGRRRLRYRRG